MSNATKPFDPAVHRASAKRELAKASFATLATSSEQGRAHVVGIRYALFDDRFCIVVHKHSIKVRNTRQNPRVALSVPVRKVPFFPPYSIQFQGTAEVVPLDDPAIRRLAESGTFRRISSTKDLRKPGQVIIRVTPGSRLSTYGLGFSPLEIVRDPQSADRSVTW